MSGTLFIIGTPIGNREDITLRALKTLFQMDILLCEDTRTTGKLLGLYDIEILTSLQIDIEKKPRLVRLDETTERGRIGQVLDWLAQGLAVGLVSDAGMPLVSDPGFQLVRECRERQIHVEVVPGASALTAAVATAGLPPDKVLFLGFLPKKTGKRAALYEKIATLRDSELVSTVVLYESPFRLKKTLLELQGALGNVLVAATGELTKLHERVLRGTVETVLADLPDTVKGEWVVLVSLHSA